MIKMNLVVVTSINTVMWWVEVGKFVCKVVQTVIQVWVLQENDLREWSLCREYWLRGGHEIVEAGVSERVLWYSMNDGELAGRD